MVFTTNDRGFVQILPVHVMEHVDKGPKDTPELSLPMSEEKPEPGREVEGTDSLGDCILINTYYPLVN